MSEAQPEKQMSPEMQAEVVEVVKETMAKEAPPIVQEAVKQAAEAVIPAVVEEAMPEPAVEVQVDERPGARAFSALLDLVDSKQETANQIAAKQAQIAVLNDEIAALESAQANLPNEARALFGRIDARKAEIADLLGVVL